MVKGFNEGRGEDRLFAIKDRLAETRLVRLML